MWKWRQNGAAYPYMGTARHFSRRLWRSRPEAKSLYWSTYVDVYTGSITNALIEMVDLLYMTDIQGNKT